MKLYFALITTQIPKMQAAKIAKVQLKKEQKAGKRLIIEAYLNSLTHNKSCFPFHDVTSSVSVSRFESGLLNHSDIFEHFKPKNISA